MVKHQAEERAIRAIESEAREAAATKDLERYVSFYADDASLFWPGTRIVIGKAATREFMRGFMSVPSFSLNFQTAKVEVCQCGNLAYSFDFNTVTFPDVKGNPLNDRGKYVTVYRKQADGGWKVVADIGNSDLPAPIPR